MNRKDYRKLMNIKKRNKNYAKLTILASLGLGIGLANSTTTHAESREWKANTSTTIKNGDTEYKILWGDTLSLISRDSGITMDTLAKLNNILNQDLIFEGNILVFGNGATASVKDSNGNIIAETPLTQADQDGIKKAQKNNTATNNTNVINNSSSSKNNGTTTNNNNGVINTVKPVKTTGNGNNSGNTGGTTNPVKPIVPIKPVDPVKPGEKEYVITICHTTEDGEVLSKEIRKAKANTTVEAKAIDFSNRGYKLIGESIQKVNVKEDTTITFTYKKIDTTKPETEKVNIEVKHLGDDGKVLSTEVIKAEKDSTVKANAKDFTSEGYVLDDRITKSVKATKDATITFNYRKIDTPVIPTEKFKVITQYVDGNGEILADPRVSDKVEKGTSYKAEAIDINGYTVRGESTQTVLVNSDTTIEFVYTKDVKPVEPVHTEETVVVNVDTNGAVLNSTNGYTYVSESTDTGKTTTAENGDTHTVYTKTVVWQKAYVPVHTEETITVNVDVNGKALSSTSGYTYVSDSTDNGKTTTQANGDTHTVYTKTVVWKKELQEYGELADKKFNDRMEAHNWAMDNQPEWSNRYSVSETETGSGIWEVYFMGWK